GETDSLERGNSPAQQTRHLQLRQTGTGEAGALAELPLHGAHDLGVPVAVNQERMISGEIEQLVSVDIDNSAAIAAIYDGRVGPMKQGTPRVAPGQGFSRFGKEAAGVRCPLPIAVFLAGSRSCDLGFHLRFHRLSRR